MTKTDIFNIFKVMFPEWAKYVTGYKKIGGRVIAIKYDMGEGKRGSLVFLYIDQNNWQFGTKLWRKRPDYIKNDLKGGKEI